MKVYSSPKIHLWDRFTIESENISSLVLMERAARVCFNWIIKHDLTSDVKIFCGKGNNGGDGLAIARMMLAEGIPVSTYILETGKPGSDDFQSNLLKLHTLTTNIHFIQSVDFFPVIGRSDNIIDALFGTGLNKPLDPLACELVETINRDAGNIISIDIPSGLYCDRSSEGNCVIRASHTLTFCLKLAFMLAENEKYTGEIINLDINLSKEFETREDSPFEMVERKWISDLLRPRKKFSHKGNYGTAALVCGSYGMMGAAILAARGCMAAGAGKLYCYVPACGYEIFQTAVPEVICRTSGQNFLEPIDPVGFDALGMGSGIGTEKTLEDVMKKIFAKVESPLVLDADALNIMASCKELKNAIPKGSILTPHPREFDRLFGSTKNDFERLELAIQKASQHNIFIILKGFRTVIITPKGRIYFNITGNPGMAKAGMGDVLTGLLTGLMAQSYPLPEAALIAVYLHGKAGDITADQYSQQAMTASDLINNVGSAWKELTTS